MSEGRRSTEAAAPASAAARAPGRRARPPGRRRGFHSTVVRGKGGLAPVSSLVFLWHRGSGYVPVYTDTSARYCGREETELERKRSVGKNLYQPGIDPGI